MTFTTLPIAYRGCLLALMTVVLLFHLYGLTTILYNGSNRRLFFVSFIMTAVSFVLFQGMIMYQQEDLAAFDIPVYILVTALILLMGFAMYLQYSNFRWKKDNISNMSINDASARGLAATNQVYHDVVDYVGDKYFELQRDVAGLAVGQANLLAH